MMADLCLTFQPTLYLVKLEYLSRWVKKIITTSLRTERSGVKHMSYRTRFANARFSVIVHSFTYLLGFYKVRFIFSSMRFISKAFSIKRFKVQARFIKDSSEVELKSALLSFCSKEGIALIL